MTANRIAKWNGSAWSALGTGMNSTVYALQVSGTDLHAGGNFSAAGGVLLNFVARWNGSAWSGLGTGMNSTVVALAVSGTDLYAGGDFTTAGGVSANHIAKWNGSAWSALGTGMNGVVRALAVIGTDLYAGGTFINAGAVSANNIAKWNGSAWSALGTGMNNPVHALAVIGTDLYAGGRFTTAGGVSGNCIAKWNGSAWSALGTGVNNAVLALAVSGTDLYAGGNFTTAGGVTASRIAKWNGSAWSALGTGMNDDVNALAVSGTDLYAGGNFTTADGVSVNYIAKWNGSAWSALGTGMNSIVRALAVSGAELYAGGNFTTADGVSANYIATWNGSAWSNLGTGMNNGVSALATDASRHLFLGGNFSIAGTTTVSPFIAQANLPMSAPEIAVTGKSNGIADGDNTPSAVDGTDFGSVQTAGDSTSVRAFTIANKGGSDLTVGAVTLTGAHAADFAVTSQPSSLVPPGGSTTFEVTFNPGGAGLRSGTISFANDDPNENPYNFAIQGAGLNDADADGVPDVTDNCPAVPNTNQLDADGDLMGDACDSDDDNDGTPDASDAFPLNPAETTDTDGDGAGNNADTDDDNDGTPDASDAFPLNPAETTDTDGDGTGNNTDTDDDNDGTPDATDVFPLNPAETTDTDGDGSGNNADSDDDNDSTPDTSDAFPLNPTETTDTDGDGTGNNADADDDNDGTPDTDDALPQDTDNDGENNAADTDDDNDGTPDATDAFPLNPAETADTDSDGTGNNADADDDNDGTSDATDAFPLNPAETTDTDGDGLGNNTDADDDNDGTPDTNDPFPQDTDNDGENNATDTDDDNDGTPDVSDAFPLNPTETVDTDGDGTGNNTDTDDDNDGVSDNNDPFPQDTDNDGENNATDTDDDNDGTPDVSDAFPLNSAETTDTDSDGTGNNADADDDNDGTSDATDAFPLNPAETTDTDGDGLGDNTDADDDNDGTPDTNDALPQDTDNDGENNASDNDDDNDGTPDATDAFPFNPTETVDTDGDGTGNNADTDDDNDGAPDTNDPFPQDTDNDGTNNATDADDDNDGTPDVTDAFPLNPAETTDTDGDGIGNNADTDDDNDGTPDNTAPVLDTSMDPRLNAVNEDAAGPAGPVGTLVSSIVDFAAPAGQVDNVTDQDSGALLGIAITDSDSAAGTWFYSIDGGTTWTPLGEVSESSARLLAANANNRLYFKPNANFNGAIANALTFRAWDQTSGAVGGVANTSPNGGTTAFSIATDTASLTVNAVNDPPLALPGSAYVHNNTATQLSLPDGNNAGPPDENQNLTLTAINGTSISIGGMVQVAHGQVTLNADSTLTYLPTAGYIGTETFDYTICDTGALCSTATITITVLPPSIPTDVSLCSEDVDGNVSNGQQFRLVFTQDPKNWPNYKLSASNPGQYRYNLFYVGEPGHQQLTVTIPYPFVTHGANPVHAYDGVVVVNGDGQACFLPGSTILVDDWQLTLANYDSNHDQKPDLSSYSTTFEVDVPASGFLYLSIHLEYGLKGTAPYGKGSLTSVNDAVTPGTTNVLIPDGATYTFSVHGAMQNQTTVQSLNAFKRQPGFGGLVLTDTACGSTPLPGRKVQIVSPTGTPIGTATTDEDGWYYFAYKHTSKAASYTIKLLKANGTVDRTQIITVKANGYAEANFTIACPVAP